MDNNKTNTFLDFNLAVVMHNFFAALKRLVWIALLLSLVVGIFAYIRTNRSYVPMYSATAVFAVNASYTTTTDILSHSDFMDASSAKTLSQTFPYIIRSENTQLLLKEKLGTNHINGTITSSSTADVGLFTLKVTSNNAEDAFRILHATIEIYPLAASNILGDTQIDVIKAPMEPVTTPINSNHALSSALQIALVTLVLGLLLIFLLSLTRKTVHSAEDLRKLVNLTCLAYIPTIQLKKRSSSSNFNLTITNPRVNPAFTESIRNLRVKLQKALPKKKNCVLLITSTLPNEGKTTVATNLALSLATEGKRVILIDGDLRKQSLKESLGIAEPSDGLVEVLTGTSKNFRLINVPKSTLLLLSGDETTDQPQSLLDSPRMQHVLDLLREKLDFIIIDSPPAGILSDAATIAKYADATLYVVRQDLASTAQIADSIQLFASNNVNIVGSVLNQTQAGTTRSGYGSKYSAAGYNYGYGYKYAASQYRYSAYGYGARRSRYAAAEEAAEQLTNEINEVTEE